MKNKCELCPRHCGVDRSMYRGYCGMPNRIKLALVQLHHWEEPIISGTNGSGTIFFSGCNLRCCYCQNWDVSNGNIGWEISVQRLEEIFQELETQGAHNINLVTPSHYVHLIRQALDLYRPSIPIIYNTSGYDSVDTLKTLEGYVDIYLTDYKYADSQLAKEYSQAEDYPTVVVKAIQEMVRQQPHNIVENGLMKKGVMIRHLILPNHSSDSVHVLENIHQYFPNVYISLMSQYTPCYQAAMHPAINRPIKKLEYTRVVQRFLRLGFQHGFMQELSSSTTDFIPIFNGKGVLKS